MSKKRIGIIAMQESWKELEDEKYTRFPEELSQMGYEHDILFFDRFFISLGDEIKFFYKEKEFDPGEYEIFLPVAGDTSEAELILEALGSAGHKFKNGLTAMSLAKDKARTLLALKKAGIPSSRAAVNFSQFFLGPLMEAWEGDDYICKLCEGSSGKGVSYIKGDLSLISIFELMVSSGIKPAQVIFEEFVRESAGRDIRIVVAGSKVICAMERTFNGFDFRANLWSGGKAKGFKPDKKMSQAALKAKRVLGLDYAGVDFVISDKGPLIIEVNSNPGLKIEEYTGVNVARGILENIL